MTAGYLVTTPVGPQEAGLVLVCHQPVQMPAILLRLRKPPLQHTPVDLEPSAPKPDSQFSKASSAVPQHQNLRGQNLLEPFMPVMCQGRDSSGTQIVVVVLPGNPSQIKEVHDPRDRLPPDRMVCGS